MSLSLSSWFRLRWPGLIALVSLGCTPQAPAPVAPVPAPSISPAPAMLGDAPSPSGIDRVRLPDLAHAPTFHGIDPREADLFWERWRLVTVRFRKDNDELRFIYANDLAWRAIDSGSATYPDGAMFGKVAAATAPDAVFPNSLVPASSPRVQLMKKDSTVYADTGGWGYAIYVARPPAQPDDEATVVRACDACHQIAQSRDFVFAQPAFSGRALTVDDAFELRFLSLDAATLGAVARAALASVDEGAASAQVLAMPLFAGSLAESVGPLAAFAVKSKSAYLLIDESTGYFLAAVAKPAPACVTPVTLAMKLKVGDRLVLRRGRACDGRVTWDPILP